MCWKLGGFNEDSTGEIGNPLAILDIIQGAIFAKVGRQIGSETQVKAVGEEVEKIRGYLSKLEELHRKGEIPDRVYRKLKEEYNRKLIESSS
jgi:hypothetical protein